MDVANVVFDCHELFYMASGALPRPNNKPAFTYEEVNTDFIEVFVCLLIYSTDLADRELH